MSDARARALGWTSIVRARGSKYGEWVHASGWFAQHCGHATAVTPWALFDPNGDMHCSGAVVGPHFNREFGYAWRTLEAAFGYVAEVLAGITPEQRRAAWELEEAEDAARQAATP